MALPGLASNVSRAIGDFGPIIPPDKDRHSKILALKLAFRAPHVTFITSLPQPHGRQPVLLPMSGEFTYVARPRSPRKAQRKDKYKVQETSVEWIDERFRDTQERFQKSALCKRYIGDSSLFLFICI
jgi:hypothetical protein